MRNFLGSIYLPLRDETRLDNSLFDFLIGQSHLVYFLIASTTWAGVTSVFRRVSFTPISMQRLTSSELVLRLVKTMTGIALVVGSSLISFRTSLPAIFGSMRSRIIKSGFSALAIS